MKRVIEGFVFVIGFYVLLFIAHAIPELLTDWILGL